MSCYLFVPGSRGQKLLDRALSSTIARRAYRNGSQNSNLISIPRPFAMRTAARVASRNGRPRCRPFEQGVGSTRASPAPSALAHVLRLLLKRGGVMLKSGARARPPGASDGKVEAAQVIPTPQKIRDWTSRADRSCRVVNDCFHSTPRKGLIDAAEKPTFLVSPSKIAPQLAVVKISRMTRSCSPRREHKTNSWRQFESNKKPFDFVNPFALSVR